MSIEVLNISRRFHQFTALDDVSLKVETGELVSLLGPSGSGKTTLLRIIAGLERADSGHVLLHGVESADIPVRKRNVGFVFQHYALFKHMTVFDNVAFGLTARPRRTRPTKAQIREKVSELLQLMQLEGLAQRLPQQLSGGQRQRVALARALAIDPKVLLLDEPFGALDAQVRKELRQWLRELHETLHVTSVFVTHDQEEALEVASRVVVMNHARIEQIGTPQQVYDEPANAFVCQFLGNVNEIVTSPLAGATSSHSRTIYVRPHDVEILANHEVRESGALAAIVENVHAAGATAKVDLRIFGNEKLLHAEISRAQEQALKLAQGAAVSVLFR